jgi:hypothetical protein
VFYEKEAMKPTQESIDYACSVEQYKSRYQLADAALHIVLVVAAVVVLLDLFVWRT